MREENKMGTSIDVYTTEPIPTALLMAAADIATNTNITLPTTPQPLIEDTAFITKKIIRSDMKWIQDIFVSTADLPSSTEPEFPVSVLCGSGARGGSQRMSSPSVTEPLDTDELFEIRTENDQIRLVDARISFTGHDSYTAAARFAFIAGPGRVIVDSNTAGETYTGQEWIDLIGK